MDTAFRKRCEYEAVRWRRQLKSPRKRGAYAYDPLPASDLATYLGLTIISPTELPDFDAKFIDQLLQKDPNSWSAVTIPVPGHKPIIIYNPSHSPARYESNIMHELAHLILKHTPVSIPQSSGFPILRQTFNAEDEKEAAYLGSCLQIPRRGLDWAIGRKMTQEQIADHFGASVQMVRYRCNMTGIKMADQDVR